MARIAYVDHSYHAKTQSTQFLPDILRRRGHSVDFFWDEEWRGGAAVPFSHVADYDVVIMFQSRCASSETHFRKLHPNVIHIPMLDQFGIHSGPHYHLGWYWEFFQGCKILSFSSALHAIATGFGLRSFSVRYYQPPKDYVPLAELPRVFFWLRHEEHVSWPIVRTLLGETHFDSVHLHIAPDPHTPKPSLPTEMERKEYNIVTSTWFAKKRDFLDILERANIFFAPRREEGIGQSFLEAMARGQCVVAPDNGTMNEYILHGVNGLLYNPEHPAPLDFSRFTKLGEAARQSVAAGYERWLAVEDRLEEFILTPCTKAYQGFYQHMPLKKEDSPVGGVMLPPVSLRQRIRNLSFMRKTEWLWLPVWWFIKDIARLRRVTAGWKYMRAFFKSFKNMLLCQKQGFTTRQYISDTFPEYHHNIILDLHKKYSLSGKRVLDVGGSNIPEELMRELGAKQFICLDPITKWENFHNDNNTPRANKFGKMIYSIDNFIDVLQDKFCFIIDTDIEDAHDIFHNYFDIVISISTFEHVTNIKECLESIYRFLRPDGILHSQYEPVFSSPAGHHCYFDHNINFVNLRQLDNIHLLYTRDEGSEFIQKTFDWPDDVKNAVIRQIYDSPIINRKTLNEHILEIMNSPFNRYFIEYFYRTPSDPTIQEKLTERFGTMRFDVRGIKLRCIKDTAR